MTTSKVLGLGDFSSPLYINSLEIKYSILIPVKLRAISVRYFDLSLLSMLLYNDQDSGKKFKFNKSKYMMKKLLPYISRVCYYSTTLLLVFTLFKPEFF